jgi:hypothetical protein
LARQHKFVQRSSTLKAHHFVDLLMFSNKPASESSLEDLVNDFCEQYGLSISKQSLQDRFNEFAVSFMSALVEVQLSRKLPVVEKTDAYHHFNRLRVKDSTRYTVPKEYASTYKGQGGIGTSAQISIQYEYDLFSGTPIALALTSACRNDQQDSKETLDDIQKGDLLMRDLAYTSKSYIKHVDQVGAYYLNRLNPTWKIYDEDGIPVSLEKIRKQLKKNDLPYLEVEAYLEINTEHFPTRLVVSRASEETYKKRIQKAQIAAKSKGYNVSKHFKTCAALQLFITNIPKDWLKTGQIKKTYSLRWQVELTFKMWKSQAGINKVKAMKIERFQCQLLARFLWILLHGQVLNLIQREFDRSSQDKLFKCSICKFYKVAFRLSNILRQALIGNQPISIWITKILHNAENKFITETKRGKPSTYKILHSL